MGRSSLIIPAYNSELSVGMSIDSALGQTRAPLEVIVIDDGSTDDTARVVEGYGDKVVLIRQENGGQGAARNAGLRAARGEFIGFLDSDDRWEPRFLERMEDFLDAHPEAVVASSAFCAERKRGTYYGPANYTELAAKHPDGLVLDNFFEFWGDHDHVRTGTVLFRRSVVDEIGLQNAQLRISQDLEYWAMIATCGKWGVVPEVLWVSNSFDIARKVGFRSKYSTRRKLAPTIPQWEERIVPRLAPEDRAGFAKSRGRVAAGLLSAHALGGSSAAARQLLDDYGDDMPQGTTTRALKLANRLGTPFWQLTVAALRMVDRLK